MYPIPANATRIRYLEINGDGAYINTGVVPKNNPRSVLRAQYLGANYSNAWIPLFGLRRWGPSGGFDVFVQLTSGQVGFDYGSASTNSGSVSASQTDFASYSLASSGGGYNGTVFSYSGSIDSIFESPVSFTLYIGGVNQRGGSTDIETRGVKLRIASFQLWNNSGEDLVFDGVPVRVGSVGYLFDRVSGQLFGNAGTGDFVLGPDTFQQGVVPTRMCVMGKHDSMVRLSSCWANGEVDLPVDFIPSDGVTVEDTIRSTGGYSGSSDRAIFGVSISSTVWQDIFCRKNGAGYCFVCCGPFGEFRWNGVSTVNDGQFHTFRSGPWTTSYSTSMTEYKVDNVSRSGVWNGKRSRTMPQNRICLFACRTYNGGLTFKCSEKSHCELKRLCFEKNGVILARYIPVRVNGTVGVYNEVSKRVFFPVSGTLGGE